MEGNYLLLRGETASGGKRDKKSVMDGSLVVDVGGRGWGADIIGSISVAELQSSKQEQECKWGS